jgi:hypothetical protein
MRPSRLGTGSFIPQARAAHDVGGMRFAEAPRIQCAPTPQLHGAAGAVQVFPPEGPRS